jgi:hypothetical protein
MLRFCASVADNPRFVSEARSMICFFNWERLTSLDWKKFINADGGGRPPTPPDASAVVVVVVVDDDAVVAVGERTDNPTGGSIGANAVATG